MNSPIPPDDQGKTQGKSPPFPHTSDMLLALLARGTFENVTLWELTAGLMNRVLGFIMLLFAVPCIVPTPPGIPFICGLVLLTCGIHLVLGRETLWLPQFIAQKSIRRSLLEKVVSRTVPVARRLERLCRPRWAWLTSRLGRAFIGGLVLMLSIILLLPIPFLGTLPPGVAIAILALGFIERDGVVIAIGALVSVVAISVTLVIAWAAIRGIASLT